MHQLVACLSKQAGVTLFLKVFSKGIDKVVKGVTSNQKRRRNDG